MPVRARSCRAPSATSPSMATLGMALFLLTQFDTNPLNSGFQLLETHSWISQLGVRWTLGVDGISLFMVALSALLFPIGILASAKVEKAQASSWSGCSARIGDDRRLFSPSTPWSSFFFFFEFVLVPMYFLIAGWGHDNRRYAAMKFFLFTMTGSRVPVRGESCRSRFMQPARHARVDVRRRHTHQLGRREHPGRNGQGASSSRSWLASRSRSRCSPSTLWLPDAHTDSRPPPVRSCWRRHAQDRCVRLSCASRSRSFPQAAVDLAPLPHRARGDRDHLRGDRRRDATELEAHHRVLVRGAPRLLWCSVCSR